jgi:ESS family glutamate:Na+ symporter
MEALVDRYGPAPRAFLVVPMVGAFFIDFVNALLITVFLNFWNELPNPPVQSQTIKTIND